MKVLVVYDSIYGNTEKIAHAIAEVFGDTASTMPVHAVSPKELTTPDLLVVACPTQAGKPTTGMQTLLAGISPDAMTGHHFAACDTRIAARKHGAPLRLLMRLIGYAAPKMAAALRARGGQEVLPPEGFIVTGKAGPLADGEIGRAHAWAREISSLLGGVEGTDAVSVLR